SKTDQTTTQADAQQAQDERTFGELSWWEVFADPVLQELIRTGIEQNYDLQIAAARVLEAGALLGITKADQYPWVGFGADAGIQQSSRNTALGSLGGDRKTGQGSIGLGVSWELDFWGKFRRATEAARAELVAAEENRLLVMQTLITGLAAAYLELRDLDWQLEIAKRTVDSRNASLRLVRLREEMGVASMIDVRQAEVLVSTAARSITELELDIELAENQISILLGQNPGPITRGRPLTEQKIIPSVPPDLPSSLLERRPDIRIAEHQMIAANARIGVAKAALLPSISLTGAAGFQSRALTDLLDGSSGVWSLGASLLQPIFQGGRLRNEVRASEAVQQQALYAYMQSTLQAFTDVSDALVSYQKSQELRAEQEHRTVVLRDATRLSQMRYSGGVTSYLEVLDNERQLFDAELELSQIRRNELLSVVALYKALGGGWQN
ncbi:MAG TPA: efflux transporter outer membrane subunit, partial [Acidobacteriota bacterium]|nr:efflux transporter outer membrane subunit [Acidobacteriota bacterium]